MQKKYIIFIGLVLVLTLTLSACLGNADKSGGESSSVSTSTDTSSASSETESAPVTEEVKTVLTNLDFKNKGTRSDGFLMGDTDGPAYCVYSNIGYNKASFEVDLSAVDLNLKRKDDGRHLNAYMSLGADIYKPNTEAWQNCIDAGLVRSGGGGGWHLFHSLYSVDESFTGSKWYESKITLPAKRRYKIELDASLEDGMATLTAYDLTDGGKAVDSVTFQLRYALKSGENVRIYQDYALDYPPNTKLDTAGNPSEDWEEITLYNTDQGIYMRNVRIENVLIYNTDGEHRWSEEHTAERGMWPDMTNEKLDYEVVKIKNPVFDSYIWFDFDMNK